MKLFWRLYPLIYWIFHAYLIHLYIYINLIYFEVYLIWLIETWTVSPLVWALGIVQSIGFYCFFNLLWGCSFLVCVVQHSAKNLREFFEDLLVFPSLSLSTSVFLYSSVFSIINSSHFSLPKYQPSVSHWDLESLGNLAPCAVIWKLILCGKLEQFQGLPWMFPLLQASSNVWN